MKWIQASSYAIQPTKEKKLMMNHLTPQGKPLACGVNADKALLLVNSKNQQKGI